jgi:hypothetical protein
VAAEFYQGGINTKIEASLARGLDNLKAAGSLG